jgi:hypothetical protein
VQQSRILRIESALEVATGLRDISVHHVAGDAPNRAFAAITQARAVCDELRVLLATDESPEAARFREQLTGIEDQLRLVEEFVEPQLE